jgi:hypothetical protein
VYRVGSAAVKPARGYAVKELEFVTIQKATPPYWYMAAQGFD